MKNDCSEVRACCLASATWAGVGPDAPDSASASQFDVGGMAQDQVYDVEGGLVVMRGVS